MMVHQSGNFELREAFTDRDQGEGFVLSANGTTSGAGKRKHIKANGIDSAGDRRMKRELLGMCEDVRHVYNLVVNWAQMYSINSIPAPKILL